MLRRRSFSAAGIGMLLGGCGGASGQVVTPSGSATAAGTPSLGKALSPFFPFGSAITPGQVLMGSADFIKDQCTIVVAENAMKPEEIAKKGEGQYTFDQADELVNFARQSNILVRGHTLIWHRQMPAWFFEGDGGEPSRAVLVARLERYITDVVGHFKGRVMAWDVVNEAYAFGEADVQTDGNGMRMSAFRRIIGEDYIEIAFRAAAKADPDALLFYNDYETQTPRKIDAITKMVKRLRAAGVKIDGIGHQAHCTIVYPAISAFENCIEEYAKLGLTQHVTELDMTLNEDISSNQVSYASAELLQRQAQRYGDLFRLFIKHKKHVTAVLVWGLDDNNTWLKYWPMRRFEAPLLFDEQRRPKPAFWAVLDASKSS